MSLFIIAIFDLKSFYELNKQTQIFFCIIHEHSLWFNCWYFFNVFLAFFWHVSEWEIAHMT